MVWRPYERDETTMRMTFVNLPAMDDGPVYKEQQ